MRNVGTNELTERTTDLPTLIYNGKIYSQKLDIINWFSPPDINWNLLST